MPQVLTAWGSVIYTGYMSKQKEYNPNSLVYKAYIRDGQIEHHGLAVLLACLAHTHGDGRNSKDMQDVLDILLDPNSK